MIKIVDLKKSFDGDMVLDGVNLTIPGEKITVILGRSGTGKTVLMKHIIGLLKPDSGSIFVDGKDIAAMDDDELDLIRSHFSMLFQGGALFDSINVFDNIAFPLREREKISAKDVEKVVTQRISEVGLTGMKRKMPAELSGGMIKRVGLARALITKPEVILFDEPTAGLDPITEDSITQLILQTHKKSPTTFIIISHDIDFTFEIADKIAILHKGKIIAEGTASEIKKTKDPFIRNYFSG